MVNPKEIKIKVNPETIKELYEIEVINRDQATKSLKEFTKDELVESFLGEFENLDDLDNEDSSDLDEGLDAKSSEPLDSEVVDKKELEDLDDFDDLD